MGVLFGRKIIVSTDYVADVKKYAETVDEACVAGIVKHCGIALQSKDASLVACADKSERDRVRDSFLKKKLAMDLSEDDLDQAVLDVCEKMKDTNQKSRVTFYYLLAEKYGKKALFT
jgi:hypothetical protein